MSNRECLAGDPSPKRVRGVRSWLKLWGIQPPGRETWSRNADLWRMAWEWAWKQTLHLSKKSGQPYYSWPTDTEIASQYLFLLLCKVRNDIRLPGRASKHLPECVQSFLLQHGVSRTDGQLPLLEVRQ